MGRHPPGLTKRPVSGRGPTLPSLAASAPEAEGRHPGAKFRQQHLEETPPRRENRCSRSCLLLVKRAAVCLGSMNPRSTILPCPNCRQRLRVPTDRGGLILTCPTCRTRWDWSPTQEGSPGRQAPDASPPVTAAQAERTDADDRVGSDPRKLSDFMVREAVITDLQATTKEGAIREIVCSLKDAGYLAEADTESIIRAILAREELGSTGIGGGMACPETRHPAVNRVIGTIGRSRQGIEFDACDGEPVDLLFLVITPGNRPGDHHRAAWRASSG